MSVQTESPVEPMPEVLTGVTLDDIPTSGIDHGMEIPAARIQTPGAQTPDFLLDIRLTVSVEVGRIQLPVRQVMELGPGSVLELQRSASEPVDVYANGRCIGRGEIVVVGEQFGIRITELGPAA